MFNIAGYLTRFKKIGEAREVLEEAVRLSFKEVAGVDIDPTSVRISKGEIIVAAPPYAHALIFMKRSDIIAALHKRLPNTRIETIRCR